MPTTRVSPIKLPADCSQEEFERACKFVKKVKETDDEERNHRGIFIQYTTAMKLYQSGSLNMIDLKNRITTIFKNCDVLLADFNRILKDSVSDSDSRRDDIVVVPSHVKRIKEFLQALRREYEELRVGFIEAFVRHKEHGDVQILKEEVDLMLRDYPCLKEEFRMIPLATTVYYKMRLRVRKMKPFDWSRIERKSLEKVQKLNETHWLFLIGQIIKIWKMFLSLRKVFGLLGLIVVPDIVSILMRSWDCSQITKGW